MTKTMSIRMDEENYDFLNRLSKEERGDMSKAVRELVNKGRLMLAVERYKEGKASLGLAAELADLTLGEMINTLERFLNRPCTPWGGRGTSARTDAGGLMRAYSMDLRERVLGLTVKKNGPPVRTRSA